MSLSRLVLVIFIASFANASSAFAAGECRSWFKRMSDIVACESCAAEYPNEDREAFCGGKITEGGGQAAPSASMPDIDPSAISKCEASMKVASECCGDPLSCFSKPDGEANEENSIVGMLLGSTATMALSLPSSSMASACGKMKTVAQSVSAINGILGAKCGHYVGVCKKACGDPMKELKIAKSGCVGKTSSDSDFDLCESIRKQYTELELNLKECQSADNASMKMAQQAAVQQLASKMADQCKKLAEAKPDDVPQDLFGNPDCSSTAAAATPFCQAKCNKAGMQNDPSCAGFFNGGDGGFGQPSPSSIGDDNPFANNVPDDEGAQNPNIPFTEAKNKGLASVEGGGGGGGGLGGGGDMGGGEGGASGGEGQAGYNTDISRGTASGNGYSVSGMAMKSGGGGGFSGYGAPGSAITDPGKKFSLKDFLPGASKNQKVAFRGIATSTPDIAPSHADIFKKVTDRFYQVCLRDGLYDCSTLQKMKKAGN
jgi:hypothetical protein